jgi:hypothetical protein
MEPMDKNPRLFGNFVVSKDDHHLNDGICSSDFSKPQIALINYFASLKYASMILHESLDLIYYWYKS